jgi:glucan biosynthesis protein C
MKRISEKPYISSRIDLYPRSSSIERLPAMDTARGILMLLGIVIHAADVYMLQSWRVHDPAGSILFDWINVVIHSFRMEAFFWVAGFFAAVSIDRHGGQGYLKRRLLQLGLPFLFTLLSFNVLEVWLIQSFPTPNAGNHDLNLVGHLWFVVDLMVISLAAMIWARKDGFLCGYAKRFESCFRSPVTMIAVMGCVVSVPVVVNALASKALGIPAALDLGIEGVTSVSRLLYYVPYFALGMAVCRCTRIRTAFGSVSPLWFVPAVILKSFLVLHPSPDVSWTLGSIPNNVLTCLIVASVISCFVRFFPRETVWTRKLADASYPVYLSHQLFVVATATLLIGFAWPAEIKFCVVMAVALAGSVVITTLAGRVRVLSWLLRGRPVDRVAVRDQTPESAVYGRLITARFALQTSAETPCTPPHSFAQTVRR